MPGRGPAPPKWKPPPGRFLGVHERAKMIRVPHKHPANDTYELHWKFGRYICQLKRLTFNYDAYASTSRGVRNFIDFESSKFVEENPNIAVYFKKRNRKPPRLIANYLNGTNRVINIPDHDSQAIWEWLDRLKSESGRHWRSERLHQPWITHQPSIQGVWTPFMFKPPVNINDDIYIDESEVD